MTLANRYQGDAYELLKSARYSGSWWNTGFALECLLKAAYMAKTGANRFPDKEDNPAVWTHNIESLFHTLGVNIAGLHRHPVGPKLKVAFQWTRRYGYNPDALPEKYARDLYEAAFGENGIAEWLISNYRLR